MSTQRPPKAESGDELSGELGDFFGPPQEGEAADWPCEPSRERKLYEERVSAGKDAPTIYTAAEVLALLRANLGNRGVSHPMHDTDVNDPFDTGLAAVCEFFDNDLSNLWLSRIVAWIGENSPVMDLLHSAQRAVVAGSGNREEPLCYLSDHNLWLLSEHPLATSLRLPPESHTFRRFAS